VPLILATKAPVFKLPFLAVTGLAAPSRGAAESCVWQLTLEPGAPGAIHSVDREEIFVALSGRAQATIGDEVHEVRAGDALIVPAGSAFALSNEGPAPFVAIAVLPVGGRAAMPGGDAFTPPWAE